MRGLGHDARRPDDEAVGSVARNKKRNAALSCAECRRLKLRCDRKFPCSACVKRGCSQICPEGSLTTGKGNRFVLANTESLHEKISELSVRVRALEDALSVAHKAISNERHPLLSDELLRVKNPLERDVNAEPVRLSEDEDTIEANGSLSYSRTGRVNYFGQTANAYYILKNEEGDPPSDDPDSNSLDPDTLSPNDLPPSYSHSLSPNIPSLLPHLASPNLNGSHLTQSQLASPNPNASLPTPTSASGTSSIASPAYTHTLPWLAHSFPFNPVVPSAGQTAAYLREQLNAALPDVEKARWLVEKYFEAAAWMYHPITRAQFDEDVFSKIYAESSTPTSQSPNPNAFAPPSPPSTLSPTSPDPSSSTSTHPSASDNNTSAPAPYTSHRLALLFAVLAVGTLVDLGQRAHAPHSRTYYQLAKAALAVESVLEEPSVVAIQALLIMCHYLFLDDVDGPRWTLMGLVVKLAQSVGLHRDSTRWNLDAEETQKRRELFWEIYVYDSWQSLTYGRPPSLAMAHVDCKMAHETRKDANGSVEMSFDAWKHRFSSECLSIVHDQVFGARTPSYSTIMELDKRVRNYYVPPSLQVPGFGGSSGYTLGSVSMGGTAMNGGGQDTPSMALTMQRHVILAIKEVTLLYMHRGFFAKAMHDHPEDPLSGKYGQSVLHAHRSASSFVALVKSMWAQHRALTERNWFVFTHVFSCAIVLGSIPTRCPSMGLARSALQSLDQAYELFTKVSETSRSSRVMPILKKLRERAHASMDEYQIQTQGQGISRDPLSISSSSMLTGTSSSAKRELHDAIVIKQEDDELATLGGKTRLVSPRPSGRGGSGGAGGSGSSGDGGVHSPTSSRGSKSPMLSPAGNSGAGSMNGSGLSQIASGSLSGPSSMNRQPPQQQQLSYVDSPMQMYPPDQLSQSHNGLTHINTSQRYPHNPQQQQQQQHHHQGSTSNAMDQTSELSSFYSMSLSPQDTINQWGQDPTIGIGYMPMQTDPLDAPLGLGIPMGNNMNNGIGMGAMNIAGAQTGYGYEYPAEMAGMRQGQVGYISTTGGPVQSHPLAHGSQDGYMQSPTSAETISPAALDDAWRGWYAQFSTA